MESNFLLFSWELLFQVFTVLVFSQFDRLSLTLFAMLFFNFSGEATKYDGTTRNLMTGILMVVRDEFVWIHSEALRRSDGRSIDAISLDRQRKRFPPVYSKNLFTIEPFDGSQPKVRTSPVVAPVTKEHIDVALKHLFNSCVRTDKDNEIVCRNGMFFRFCESREELVRLQLESKALKPHHFELGTINHPNRWRPRDI